MEVGNGSPRILIIGEAPGEHEDKLGRPFVGESGTLLRDALETAFSTVGITEDVKPWITNAVKCRPPKNNTPSKKSCTACHPYTIEDIKKADPDLILVCGAVPLSCLMGVSGIRKHRGRRMLFELDGKKIPVFPIYHPAYILRSIDSLPEWVSDIERALSSYNVVAPDELPYIEQTVDKVIELAYEEKEIVYDVETNKLLDMMDPAGFMTIIGIGVPHEGVLHVASIPAYSDEVLGGKLLRKLRKLFNSKDITKIAHNQKFDNGWLRLKKGIDVHGKFFDTMVAFYIGVSEESSSSLKSLSYLYTDYGGYEETLHGNEEYESLPKAFTLQQYLELSNESKEIEKHYNFMDLYVTYECYKGLRPVIDHDKGFKRVFYDILMEAIKSFSYVEEDGCKIDKRRYIEMTEEAYRRLVKYHYEFWYLCLKAGVKGYDIWYENEDDVDGYLEGIPKKSDSKMLNLGSWHHILDIFYKQLKFPVIEKTKSGNPSTAKKVLDKLFAREDLEHTEIAFALAKWRAVETVRKMFLAPMVYHVDKDWFVHPKYSLTTEDKAEYGAGSGTVTGRPSSANPNFQQLPRNIVEGLTPLEKQRYEALNGLEVRKLYVSRFKDGSILQADYSQIELRLAAILSKDKNMIGVFNSGEDIHKATASKMFNVPIEEITKEQRWHAKAINFGIIYGKGFHSLAEELKITEDEARKFIKMYFYQFPDLGKWIKRVQSHVKRTGTIRTYFGRLRRLPGARSTDKGMVAASMRQAVNTNPQGSASDMLISSSSKVSRYLRENGYKAKVIGTIHDEIVLDVPSDEVEALKPLIKRIMEDWDEENFPIDIKVDIAVGPSLGESGK